MAQVETLSVRRQTILGEGISEDVLKLFGKVEIREVEPLAGSASSQVSTLQWKPHPQLNFHVTIL